MIKYYPKPEYHYLLADRWFRILEFSIILGTLHYFSNITGSILLKFIYYISWFMFFNWFLELGEFLSSKIYSGKNSVKILLIGLLSIIPFGIIFIFVNKVSDTIVSIGK